MTGVDWKVEHHRGSAAAFHAKDVPADAPASLWWFEVERPAVVLGSTQAEDVVDRSRAEVAGVEVARRRSGGGAVYLAPEQSTWIDVILPASDVRWDADVGRSFGWLGRAWASAVEQLTGGPALAHDGPLLRTPWSDLVCFAGLGPGEVTVGGRKLVGIAQRRTRTHARFQCALLHAWDPVPLLDVLTLPESDRARAGADLSGAGVGVDDLTAVPISSAQVIDLLLVTMEGTART